jgi:hypothetical protein
MCLLRMRTLMSNRDCVICKVAADIVIVPDDDATERCFQDHQVWGNEIGPGYTFDDDARMFLPNKYYNRHVVTLYSRKCNMREAKDGRKLCEFDCTDDANSAPALLNAAAATTTDAALQNNENPPPALVPLLQHLHAEHNQATICVLCYAAKRNFLSLLPRLTPDNFQRHLRKGDGEKSGFTGHPLCEFCRPRRFYDLEALHNHLNKDHYKCHLCAAQGNPNQFFKDYKSLERHFDRGHFLCPDPSCRGARFVAFGTEIDYKGHMMEVHGSANVDTKIKLEFKVRSAGYDGSGITEPTEYEGDATADFPALEGVFVPESVGAPAAQENEEDITDPTHRDRTAALRAEASEIRMKKQREEDYPTLEGSGAAAGAFVGWGGSSTSHNSVGSTKTREEAFPALGKPSSSSQKSAATKRRDPRAAPKSNNISGLASKAMEEFMNAPMAGKNRASAAAAASSVSRMMAAATVKEPVAYKPSEMSSWGAAALSKAAEADDAGGSGWVTKPSAAQQQQSQKAPVMTDEEFPTMMGGGGGKKNKVAKKPSPLSSNILQGANQRKPMSAEAMASSHRVQLDVLKANMTKDGYKELKRLTKDFFNDRLDAEPYVNQASVLFDGRGKMFIDFMPALLSSFPDQMKVAGALSLVDSIGQAMAEWEAGQEVGGDQEQQQASSGWGGAAVRAAPIQPKNASAPVARAPAPAPRAPPAPVYVRPPSPPIAPARVAPPGFATLSSGTKVKFGGSKTNAWGTATGGGKVDKKKGAGRNDDDEGYSGPTITSKDVGTSTKAEAAYKKALRAEEQAAQEAAQGGGGGKKKANKKKQNEELRNMLFGGGGGR